RFHFFPVVWAPHRLEQPPMCQSFSLVYHELAQQLELLRSQAHFMSFRRYSAPLEINLQVRGDEAGSLLRSGSAQSRANARGEFFGTERFHDVVVRTRVKRLHLVPL